MSERLIVHVLPGRSVHHAVPMIRSFHQNADEMGLGGAEQMFVLCGVEPDRTEYFRDLGPPADRILIHPDWTLPPDLFDRAGKEARFVFHSAFFTGLWDELHRRPGVVDRAAVVFWGADLKPVLQRTSISLRSIVRRPDRFARWLRRRYGLRRVLRIEGAVLRSLRVVATLTPGEMEIIERQFGPCANYQPIVYHTHPRDIPLLPAPDHGGDLRVVVGNSAHSGSFHLATLPWLARFRDEPLRVICPLAYPRVSPYKDEVIRTGERLFGRKFEPRPDLVSLEEYNRFFDTVDVFILNASNQQGLYGIYYLLMRGKKIYLSPRSPVYRMLSFLGIRVFDVRELLSISFPELGAYSEKDRTRNAEIAVCHFSLQAAFGRWKELFSRLDI